MVAGVRIRAPMMEINTVAAGGGSVCRFDGMRFRVGPECAGAQPGPACYRGGGPLTVTDCNLVLGRIVPDQFPPCLARKATNRSTWRHRKRGSMRSRINSAAAAFSKKLRQASWPSPSTIWRLRSARSRLRAATTSAAHHGLLRRRRRAACVQRRGSARHAADPDPPACGRPVRLRDRPCGSEGDP